MNREQAYRSTIHLRAVLVQIGEVWSHAPEIKRHVDGAIRASLRMKLAIEKREGRVPKLPSEYANRRRKRR